MLLAALALAAPRAVVAQAPEAERDVGRRGGGVLVGSWKVSNPDIVRTVQPSYRRSVMVQAYFRRGLTEHVALENSVSVWRRMSERPSALGSTITTRTYIVPLLTSLRVYPITRTYHRFEPYLTGGAGLAVGVQQQSENAPGGGGRNIATGFGVKAGAGVEIHAYRRFSIMLGGHVQGVRFGEQLDEQEGFGGRGLEGGLNYRFNL